MNKTLKQALGVDVTLIAIPVVLVAVLFGTFSATARPGGPPPTKKKFKVVFEPRLEFPLADGENFVPLGKDGLIPVKVVAHLKNDSRDMPVFWRVTATELGVVNGKAAHEEKWKGEYPHLRFTIKKGTDKDRVFTEKIQMPPGLYSVLVELCSEEVMPDLKSRERVAGVALTSGTFLCRVP